MGTLTQPATRVASPSGAVVVVLPPEALVALPGAAALVRQQGVVQTGLVAELLLAILSHTSDLHATAKGSLELHWGPNGVQGRLHPVWEQTISPVLAARYSGAARGRLRGRRRTITVEGPGQHLHIHGTEVPPWA